MIRPLSIDYSEERGTNQVGATIAALRGGAVAEAAVSDKDFLPSLHGGGIGNRSADEHVATRTGSGGRRGLCDQRGRVKQ